jgi:outer membrane protein assembly factor BamB
MDAKDRDTETGRWKQPPLEIHWNTPVLHDGYLYAYSGRNEPDATFRCVELKTGRVMWSRDERWPGHPPPSAKAQPAVFGRGSAILADGKLLTLGEGGLLGLFKPNYLRSENRLVCLDFARPN